MGDSMGISAPTTIFLIYVGLKFGGLGGMLLALDPWNVCDQFILIRSV